MKTFVFLVSSLLLNGCASLDRSPQQTKLSGEHTVAGFYCPIAGSKQVEIADAYRAIPADSGWGMIIFSEVDPPENIKKYDYQKNTEENPYFDKGIFYVRPGASESVDCARQIQITGPASMLNNPSKQSNVWEGHIFIELCEGGAPFTPKVDVLEYAGPNKKRTRQKIKKLWFTNEEGACVLNTESPDIDFQEGRNFGVGYSYRFVREN